jgi:DNA-binding IclR family transcriptional regulator
MIQVIERVEKILTYLSENKTREVPLTEIADNLGINRATCANILKTMRELGFVEQSSYRKGYILGDKVYTIAGVENDPDQLKARLKPLIDNLCKEINENVMLTVIRNDQRYHIYSAEANHALQAKVIYQMGVWQATTAKVIIAQYDKERLLDFLKLAGMPGKDWPQIKTRQDLMNKLEEIRKDKCYTVINEHFACMAAPLFKNGKVIASLGFYLPDVRLTEQNKPLLEAKLREAVEKAEAILL